MRALIIEDELPAANRLKQMVSEIDSKIEIVDVIDSIEDSVLWLKSMKMPDLIFIDIQLADGLSFEIFESVKITCPVIFTTAFDHFALKAIKLNSVDYLLKPIEKEELKEALGKVAQRILPTNIDISKLLETIKNESKSKNYKERFLVKVGDQLKYVPAEKIAYFYFDEGYSHLCTHDGKKLILDFSLDQLNEMINPKEFFRVSRKLIINHKSIDKIHSWFNSRLKLDLLPTPSFEIIVSRERVGEFKAWLDQ